MGKRTDLPTGPRDYETLFFARSALLSGRRGRLGGSATSAISSQPVCRMADGGRSPHVGRRRGRRPRQAQAPTAGDHVRRLHARLDRRRRAGAQGNRPEERLRGHLLPLHQGSGRQGNCQEEGQRQGRGSRDDGPGEVQRAVPPHHRREGQGPRGGHQGAVRPDQRRHPQEIRRGTLFHNRQAPPRPRRRTWSPG